MKRCLLVMGCCGYHSALDNACRFAHMRCTKDTKKYDGQGVGSPAIDRCLCPGKLLGLNLGVMSAARGMSGSSVRSGGSMPVSPFARLSRHKRSSSTDAFKKPAGMTPEPTQPSTPSMGTHLPDSPCEPTARTSSSGPRHSGKLFGMGRKRSTGLRAEPADATSSVQGGWGSHLRGLPVGGDAAGAGRLASASTPSPLGPIPTPPTTGLEAGQTPPAISASAAGGGLGHGPSARNGPSASYTSGPPAMNPSAAPAFSGQGNGPSAGYSSAASYSTDPSAVTPPVALSSNGRVDGSTARAQIAMSPPAQPTAGGWTRESTASQTGYRPAANHSSKDGRPYSERSTAAASSGASSAGPSQPSASMQPGWSHTEQHAASGFPDDARGIHNGAQMNGLAARSLLVPQAPQATSLASPTGSTSSFRSLDSNIGPLDAPFASPSAAEDFQAGHGWTSEPYVPFTEQLAHSGNGWAQSGARSPVSGMASEGLPWHQGSSVGTPRPGRLQGGNDDLPGRDLAEAIPGAAFGSSNGGASAQAPIQYGQPGASEQWDTQPGGIQASP